MERGMYQYDYWVNDANICNPVATMGGGQATNSHYPPPKVSALFDSTCPPCPPPPHPSVMSQPGLVVPQPLKPSRSAKTYHCRMCEQVFDCKSDLLVHSQQVHKQDPKPYKCPTCNKCFANSSYLSQHARIHSGIKPYRCNICDRRFTQLCHLQQHMRTHTGEKPYKCSHPSCGKAFTQLSSLQSHSRSHMTDKPYRCNSCYKCFSDEQALRDHIPKHSETKHLKTHICHVCGKSYTQETYLARHMQKHAYDRNCPIQPGQQQTPTVTQHHHPATSIFDLAPPGPHTLAPITSLTQSHQDDIKCSAFLPISSFASLAPPPPPPPLPSQYNGLQSSEFSTSTPATSSTSSNRRPDNSAVTSSPFLSLQQIKSYSNQNSFFPSVSTSSSPKDHQQPYV
ncbi:DgyrCDS14450 [Dimorphilus gyrociliatus]|uniref:DgyrCDS14450 n=1 Tax=Dimorphilus gyrociliatus TaxID=2664684 RepID=A0A7I8WDN0_9ANNE|nr:DgyrCDS14450 [Dimorphilus gyrociliatus]